MREVAFAHKQRAIRQALQMGEQIARRRARAALAAAFTAWRVQVIAGCGSGLEDWETEPRLYLHPDIKPAWPRPHLRWVCLNDHKTKPESQNQQSTRLTQPTPPRCKSTGGWQTGWQACWS